jgi:hypothetical protein
MRTVRDANGARSRLFLSQSVSSTDMSGGMTSGRCFTPREVYNASERKAEAPLDMDQQHIAKAVANKQQHQDQSAGYDGGKA